MAKRGLCILLAILTVFSLAIPAFAAETSGKCGDNVKWSLSGGTLTISGKGKMADYEWDAPWDDVRDQIKKIVIKSGVTNIGSLAFAGLTSLTDITIPTSVTNIRTSAFYDCSSLKSVTIPSSVTSIEEGAFAGCRGLTSMTFPEGVTSIKNFLFSGCTNLKKVTIPSSLTSIGEFAFSDDPVENIEVAAGNKNYASKDGVLFNKALTKLIRYGKSGGAYSIPDSVVSIENSAFARCRGLTSVTIPNSVTSIGGFAFSGCESLTSVMIPASVTSIKNNAFSYCLGLTNVTVPASVTSIGAGAFFGCSSLTGITVQNPKCKIDCDTTWYEFGDSLGDPKKATVKGYDGSTAETFAKKYGYTFKSLGKAPGAAKPTQLAAPTVKIAQTDGGIKVTWNAVSGSPQYMVYYKENGGSWTKIGTTSKTSYTHAAKKLKNGATYQFTVRCCASDKKTLLGSYKASNSVKYAVELAAPTVKIAQTKSGIQVTWNAVSGSPQYVVYYKENGGKWQTIGTTSKTSYTHAAKKLKNGVTYQFTVRCCASDKKTLLSPYKASNSVKYIVELAAPAVKIAQTKSGIQVTWNAVSGSPQYVVYYKENGGKWQQIGTTSKTSYTHAAKKLKNGVTYQFTVRCCASDKKTLLSDYAASNKVQYTK